MRTCAGSVAAWVRLKACDALSAARSGAAADAVDVVAAWCAAAQAAGGGELAAGAGCTDKTAPLSKWCCCRHCQGCTYEAQHQGVKHVNRTHAPSAAFNARRPQGTEAADCSC